MEINRLVSYGKSGSVIHLHHAVGETIENKKSLYIDAMKKLAAIIDNDPEVQTITATSWVVAKLQMLFIRFGFKTMDVSDDFRKKYFSGDEREIKIATISRDDFLKRFLDKTSR